MTNKRLQAELESEYLPHEKFIIYHREDGDSGNWSCVPTLASDFKVLKGNVNRKQILKQMLRRKLEYEPRFARGWIQDDGKLLKLVYDNRRFGKIVVELRRSEISDILYDDVSKFTENLDRI